MKKAIGIYREIKLAGKPELDQRILDLTAGELRKRNFWVLIKRPEELNKKENVDLIFTMARGKEINEILEEKEKEKVLVINSPQAIRFSFNRKLTYQKMKELGANVPQTKVIKIKDIKFSNLEGKSILKPAQRHEFWFVIENEDDYHKAMEEYKTQRIEEIVCQKFIEGESIKYYAIDDKIILPKEVIQKFSKQTLEEIKKQTLLTAKATGLRIFGGDFIVKENIPFWIDANDWPSMGSIEGFSQKEGAEKIANLIEKEYYAYQKSQKNI